MVTVFATDIAKCCLFTKFLMKDSVVIIMLICDYYVEKYAV